MSTELTPEQAKKLQLVKDGLICHTFNFIRTHHEIEWRAHIVETLELAMPNTPPIKLEELALHARDELMREVGMRMLDSLKEKLFA